MLATAPGFNIQFLKYTAPGFNMFKLMIFQLFDILRENKNFGRI